MRITRIAACLLAVSLMSGCAVNRATATVDPSANLASLKRLHVVKDKEDERGIDRLIAERLEKMGYTATTGDDKAKGVDAIVTYVDKWFWDITMYMIELTIVVRDPANDFPLATGNSLHTSLTRLSPPAMVEEVTGNIFKGVNKQ